MAPALTSPIPNEHPNPTTPASKAPKAIFPDGIRTSGQHEPIYTQLQPYTSFPKTITGPTAWTKSEYASNPERWTHIFSADEISEISSATDAFLASATPLTGISRASFPLPHFLSSFLHPLRNELLNGKGFVLFKGLPVRRWGTRKSAVAYMGLGTHLGYFVSQNSRGHVLGHVKDLGEDAGAIDKVRIYRTNARQWFHGDDADLVGLLCVEKAAEGGESDLVSSHLVWNELQTYHPDVAELLTQPVWYFDRKGETSKGQKEWIRSSVFMLETAEKPRVCCKWDPYYVRSLTRFSDAGFIPPLSDAQERAINVLEETCQKLALHMVLDVGDIQFLSNNHVLHARTAYKDYAPPAPRRHLMRLWLSTPEDEGGWKLPFHDSNEKKRGGIQVDDTAPVAPEDAE
ncbi:taurine catabolism dioxygenase TauD [Decorospora gaudefroyi]|uniref:Taurine catabolism dioxygenase TauD n=1 Tax=Decorospora gaudefroyi TaxID=184978 RepID=A0A6A5KXV2_9PLEO|nr:taurine catabolism dioxygenase TauD [Decorospora gaudefroyi]